MQKVVHAPAPAACRLLSCFRLLAACLLLLSPPTVLPCRCLLPPTLPPHEPRMPARVWPRSAALPREPVHAGLVLCSHSPARAPASPLLASSARQ